MTVVDSLAPYSPQPGAMHSTSMQRFPGTQHLTCKACEAAYWAGPSKCRHTPKAACTLQGVRTSWSAFTPWVCVCMLRWSCSWRDVVRLCCRVSGRSWPAMSSPAMRKWKRAGTSTRPGPGGRTMCRSAPCEGPVQGVEPLEDMNASVEREGPAASTKSGPGGLMMCSSAPCKGLIQGVGC